MENNKNKKSVKFQGDMLNFCDFIQVFVFTRNHHLNGSSDMSKSGLANFQLPAVRGETIISFCEVNYMLG